MGTNFNEKDVLGRLQEGNTSVISEGFAVHRARLKRMVRLRMDHRLQGRVDASDIMQEAFLEATQRLAEYVKDPAVPFILWLRYLTAQKLTEAHRRHLGTKARDVGREISIDAGVVPEASSFILAENLIDRFSTPRVAAMRLEQRLQLQQALDQIDPLDREITLEIP